MSNKSFALNRYMDLFSISYTSRLEMAKKLEEDNKRVLSTPLMSEGQLSPAQLGMMSARQRKERHRDIDKKFEIKEQISLLKCDNTTLAKLIWETKAGMLSELIDQQKAMIDTLSGFIKDGYRVSVYTKEVHRLNESVAKNTEERDRCVKFLSNTDESKGEKENV